MWWKMLCAALLLKVAGRNSRHFLKNLAKIVRVVKPKKIRDLVHQVFVRCDQLFCMVNLDCRNVIDQVCPRKPLECDTNRTIDFGNSSTIRYWLALLCWGLSCFAK